jgi:hypothetical protein
MIPGKTLEILSNKPRRNLVGLPDDLPIKPFRIACRRADGRPLTGVAKAVGVGAGSAGGIMVAVGAGGDGDRQASSWLGIARMARAVPDLQLTI